MRNMSLFFLNSISNYWEKSAVEVRLKIFKLAENFENERGLWLSFEVKIEKFLVLTLDFWQYLHEENQRNLSCLSYVAIMKNSGILLVKTINKYGNMFFQAVYGC